MPSTVTNTIRRRVASATTSTGESTEPMSSPTSGSNDIKSKRKTPSNENYCHQHEIDHDQNQSKNIETDSNISTNKDHKSSNITSIQYLQQFLTLIFTYLLSKSQNIANSINDGFKRRPMWYGCCFSGAKGIVADNFAQVVIQGKSFDQINFHRTQLFAFIGMAYIFSICIA